MLLEMMLRMNQNNECKELRGSESGYNDLYVCCYEPQLSHVVIRSSVITKIFISAALS